MEGAAMQWAACRDEVPELGSGCWRKTAFLFKPLETENAAPEPQPGRARRRARARRRRPSPEPDARASSPDSSGGAVPEAAA